MNTNRATLVQLFLRLALSVSFLSAVADRLGFWGTEHVSWGNWENFVAYSQRVNSFANAQINIVLAIVATTLEILLPVLFLIGYKIKIAATVSAVLLLCFALAMTYSFGLKPSLDYSVWTAAAASFALAALGDYRYSIDQLLAEK
ncbi:DoxX family membrane protein [Taibaiella soli]|uniref:DoxX family protein n=1 Tax=Taibaiella soli TaxID=1649169 RepID=A0A2W2AK62_9BACT|nr:DoxX family membrane protein [Taibaiella soli]PZF72640.1 DoxX family protein [Taibaiella soli]